MNGRHRWELALIAITAIWGSTFVVVKDAVARTPPFQFLALRFIIAAAALGIAGAFRGLLRRDVLAGVVIGAALFGGYAFQTVGLQYTSASNTGLITGLYVIITPMLAAVTLRRLPSVPALFGAGLATGGLVLLAMPSGFHLRRGDLIVLLCAVTFSVHILLLGRLAPGAPAAGLAGVQIATAAVLSLLWSVAAEPIHLTAVPASTWSAIAITGILATAVAFLVQTRAQQHVTPSRTALILGLEAVFAAIFGYLIAGDRLHARGYAGGALIVAGVLIAEVLAPAEKERV